MGATIKLGFALRFLRELGSFGKERSRKENYRQRESRGRRGGHTLSG